MKEAARQEFSVVRIPKIGLLSGNARTFWRNTNWPGADGVYSNSSQLEEFFFTEVVPSASRLSLRTDWFLVGIKAIKDGRLSSSHHFTFLEEVLKKKNIMMITQFSKSALPQSLETQSSCSVMCEIIPSRRPRIANLAHAIIVHSPVPAEGIYKLFSLNGDRILFERLNPTTNAQSHIEKQLATAAAAVDLWWCDWNLKGGGEGEPVLDKRHQRLYNRWSNWYKESCTRFWNTCWDKATIRNWSSSGRSISRCYLTRWRKRWMRSTKSLKYWKWDHVQNPFVTKLSNDDMISSEESSRAIYEMGNMEMIELTQTSATIQCPSCLKHALEGMNMCPCGIWLRPNQSTDRIRIAFAAFKTPYCRTAVIRSKGLKSGHNSWQKDHHKVMDAKRGVPKRGKYTSLWDRLAEWRGFPRISIGTWMDWRVGQVPRLHLRDRHQSECTSPTTTTIWKTGLHDRRWCQ